MLKQTVAPHLRLGQEGEDWATQFLNGIGFAILGRNWRFKQLELDIIAREKDTIVFVEVKTRTTNLHGEPSSAVTQKKQSKLARAAQTWISVNDCWQHPCRFDIICLVGSPSDFHVEHYRNAFDFPQTMGCRNPHWQPW